MYISGAAAAAAKSLQWCPTLCNTIDGSPPGSSVHGIFQARVLEWGAIAFSGIWLWIIIKGSRGSKNVPWGALPTLVMKFVAIVQKYLK